MGKLGGGSGIGHLWLCSCKTPDILYGSADTLHSYICANLIQHALTTSNLASFALHPPCSTLSICLHFCSMSPNWFHPNTPPPLLFNPCIPFLFLACLLCSLNLYLLCFASHTVRDSLFSQTPVALAQGVVSYDLPVCTCVSQQGYFAPLMNCLHAPRQVQTCHSICFICAQP